MEQRFGSELKKEANDYWIQSEKPLPVFYKRRSPAEQHTTLIIM